RDDLGRLALVAFLVFPVARLDAPLDVDLAALAQVLAADLGEPRPGDDAVPLGAVLPVAVPVLEPLVGGDRERGDRLPALRIAELRGATYVAHDDDFVDAGHGFSLSVVVRVRRRRQATG